MYVTIKKQKKLQSLLAGCLSVPHKKHKNHMRNGLLAGLGRVVAVAGCGWLGGVGCGCLWLAVSAGPVGIYR